MNSKNANFFKRAKPFDPYIKRIEIINLISKSFSKLIDK